MNEPVSISVILITFGRGVMLKACLESLAAAKTPEMTEVIVALNGRDPETSGLLRACAARYDFLKVIELPRMCRGEARNAALKASGGAWLCFLDDDTEVPLDYFSNLVREINAGGADVLGGGQTIDLKTAPVFEKAVYFTLSSFWGAGPFRVRFRPFEGARAAGPEEFILANLALRRTALENNSLAFEGHLTSAEENLLLNKLARLGSAMRLSERLNLLHKRRPNYISFARQLFHSGMGRAQMTFLYPAGLSLFITLPVLGLPVSAAGLFLAPALFRAAACGYLAVCAVFALRTAAVSGIKAACVSFSLFPVVHISYAAGWWRGAFGMLTDSLGGSRDFSRCVCGRERH
jgi:hypothetical protein